MTQQQSPSRGRGRWAWPLLALALASLAAEPAGAARRFPNIAIITVDTLRLDRLSGYGYERPTSPNVDRLMARGARFTQARVVEPLTTPSLCSMLTSLYPHEHAATRNGLAMRPGLTSLPTILKRRRYQTAAFVGNWTLRDRLSGLGEHFDDYREVFTRKRWLGLFNAEATADDLTAQAVAWLDDLEQPQRAPFLIWVHYVEPHAPYRFHAEHAAALGIDASNGGEASPHERYDTEVAFVDRAIGELLEALRARVPAEDLLIVFVADHGESLGEHGYWGHGRHLYDVTLLVPFAIIWEPRIPPGTVVDALASNLDLGPTILGLLGLPSPESFRGHDWSAVLTSEAGGDGPRRTFHQAHKGAIRGSGGQRARKNGLLEVGMVTPGIKQILNLRRAQRLRRFDLNADPGEVSDLAAGDGELPPALRAWLAEVRAGLETADLLPAPALDEESVEKLKALGYIDD